MWYLNSDIFNNSLCYYYLRDIEEEENTLMRKRVSASGW